MAYARGDYDVFLSVFSDFDEAHGDGMARLCLTGSGGRECKTSSCATKASWYLEKVAVD